MCAQIGHGYGSEFQLLRFLGHHRHELESIISNTIGEDGVYNWLDFGYVDQREVKSGDREIVALNFLRELIPEQKYNEVIAKYHSYNIGNSDSWQNWDAVFVLNGCIYFVEAKAHVEEMSGNKTGNGGGSKDAIMKYFTEQLPQCNITEEWLKEYYQLANRLATTALLNNHGVKARTLYIYFENGYNDPDEPKNAVKSDYLEAIEKEYQALGITESEVSQLLAPPVFINANPTQRK